MQSHCTVARKVKTLPRIQKHFPESKTRPRIQKHFPESKNTSQNPKHFPEFKNTLQNPDSGLSFGFLDLFWILGSVLESGKCLVLMSHRSIDFKLVFRKLR